MGNKGALFLVSILLVMIFFAGCGGEEKAVSIDVNALADQLASEVAFEDQLSQVDEDTALLLYALSEDMVTACGVYAGTGATAEEIAVFEAVDGEAVKTIKEHITVRMESQLSDYADYNPAEVPKLENRIVMEKGNYVILCVTQDLDTAQSIIDGMLK